MGNELMVRLLELGVKSRWASHGSRSLYIAVKASLDETTYVRSC